LLCSLKSVYRTLGLQQCHTNDLRFQKNRPPDERRPIDLTNPTNLPLRLEVESDTRANQVLPQIPTIAGVDLGARVNEVVVFDEGAELRGPIII
jgi:hypothetical protein